MLTARKLFFYQALRIYIYLANITVICFASLAVIYRYNTFTMFRILLPTHIVGKVVFFVLFYTFPLFLIIIHYEILRYPHKLNQKANVHPLMIIIGCIWFSFFLFILSDAWVWLCVNLIGPSLSNATVGTSGHYTSSSPIRTTTATTS